MAISTTDTKLRFLSGLSTNLNALEVQNGNVYVTTDEHIMYVDINDERLRLSDIVWVENQSDLPQTLPPEQSHALYYVATGNILLRYNFDNNNKGWTQINAYPALQSIVKESSVTYSAVTNGAKAKLTLKDKNDKDVTANFNVAVTSGNTTTTNVSQSASSIVVKSADTIKSSAISASYDSSSKQSSITVTETTSGFNADGSAKSGTDTTSVSIAGNGLTSSVTGNVITLNAKPTSITPSFDTAGAFKIAYTSPDSKVTDSTTITPTIQIGKGSAKAEAKFVSGTATFNNVYTATEVDNAIAAQLKTANAMVFQGTVAPDKNLPVSAALGATYVVETAGKIGTSSTATIVNDAKVGDMFIASGTEGANGLISTVDWKYIPAGNDDIPMYSATVTADKITLVQALAGKNTDVGAIDVGNKLSGSVNGKVLTINHATQSVTATTPTVEANAYTNQIVAVSSVGYDTYGHITSLATTTYKIPDFNLKSITYAATLDKTTPNKATVKNTITLANNNSKFGSFDIKSNNLEVTASGSTVNIDLVWGTF